MDLKSISFCKSGCPLDEIIRPDRLHPSPVETRNSAAPVPFHGILRNLDAGAGGDAHKVLVREGDLSPAVALRPIHVTEIDGCPQGDRYGNIPSRLQDVNAALNKGDLADRGGKGRICRDEKHNETYNDDAHKEVIFLHGVYLAMFELVEYPILTYRLVVSYIE
ncbi:MAG: hypothetical protein A4E64_00167 [Syntrophorhabdus sp. PtaU1.Bin058]|nr:MAG: hypothetical protein A4E64_00167 [Syntrophorhabdus sp. PtaU1.Bin058]